MTTIEERAVIDAPPAAVFDYRLDFAANLGAYNPSVREIAQVEGHGPGVGAVYSLRVRLLPGITAAASLTVTEATRPSVVANSADAVIPADERVSIALTYADGHMRTGVSFSVQTRPRSLLWRTADLMIGRRLAGRQVRTELRLIRRELEAAARA